tara:strand:+ start:29 stop:889 length:861 start_codon:yes stop_codon:yes gene_type:complete
MLSPNYESITSDVSHSFTLKVFNQEHPNSANLNWHYHPEIELVYIDKGTGKRGVGTHLSNYTNGDLIMIGSNLHHSGFTENFEDGKTEVVVQFLPDFIGTALSKAPEFQSIIKLFDNSKCGLSFPESVKNRVGDALLGLQYETSFERILTLLRVLKNLAAQKPVFLNNSNLEELNNNNELKRLFNFVKYNFQSELNLKLASEKVGMTIPAFCRYFKKNTGKTFIQFVNEYRINHAAKLLIETDLDIQSICYDSGFNNFSNFSRFFKLHHKLTPKNFRKMMIKTLSE